jgi:hypothetical protein
MRNLISVSCCEMCALDGKLSKFILPALVLMSSTRRQLRKMVTSGEHKSFCVLDFHVNKSVVSVQRHFRTKSGTDPPSGKSIRKWYLQFQDTGCIWKRKSTGFPSTEEEAVERVCTRFIWSRTDALATTFPRSHPAWFLLVRFHQGLCFCNTTSCNAGWPAHAHHSSYHKWLTTTCYKEFGRNLITSLMCCVMGGVHIEYL